MKLGLCSPVHLVNQFGFRRLSHVYGIEIWLDYRINMGSGQTMACLLGQHGLVPMRAFDDLPAETSDAFTEYLEGGLGRVLKCATCPHPHTSHQGIFLPAHGCEGRFHHNGIQIHWIVGAVTKEYEELCQHITENITETTTAKPKAEP